MRLPEALTLTWAAVASALAPLPASSQPISQSMAQCAGLYRLAADWTTRPGMVENLASAADTWHAEAVAAATRESRPRPAAYVDLHQAEAYAEWHANGRLWIASEEFRDWAGYCRSLARHRGIDVLPG